MKRALRSFSFGLLLALAGSVVAQEYPTRPLRLVLPLAPGGVTDVMARLIATEMAKQLGQPIVVENRTGANGAIAGDAVAKSAPDGYTIGFFPSSTTVLLPLLGKTPYTMTSFTAPIRLYDLDLFVIARSDFAASTLAELIAMARAQPGKLSYGTTGIGGPLHLGWELLKSEGKFDMTHVPYKGGAPQINDLLGGHLNVAIVGTYDAGVWAKQGKVKMLASLAAKRNPVFPDVATIAESGFPGFVANSWAALFVPAGTRPDVMERIAQAARTALAERTVRDRLLTNGLTPTGDERPDELAASMRAEAEKWARVVKQLGPMNLD